MNTTIRRGIAGIAATGLLGAGLFMGAGTATAGGNHHHHDKWGGNHHSWHKGEWKWHAGYWDNCGKWHKGWWGWDWH